MMDFQMLRDDMRDRVSKHWFALVVLCVAVLLLSMVLLFLAGGQIAPYEEACRAYYTKVLDGCSCPNLEPLVFPK